MGVEAELARLREALGETRNERNDLIAQRDTLLAALEHGIIAYAGLKQFAEQQLGKTIAGGVWPDEASAAISKVEGEK